MKKKTIKFGLSVSEINKAIKELEQYKRELVRKTDLLRERVAQRLAELAESGFSGAIVDDFMQEGVRTADVSVSVDERDNVTVVVASGEDAVWVEFGTGVFYNGSAGSSPHPKGAELGFTIGTYGKGQGKRKAWGFTDTEGHHLTHGAPAVMPMYNAVKLVSDEVIEIAKEVFA